MRRPDWISLVLLVIAAGIGIFILTKYHALSEQVEAQRAEIRQTRAEIRKTQAEIRQARAELERSNRRLAATEANRLYMQDSIYATTDFLDLHLLNPLCTSRPEDAYIQSLCRYQDDMQALIRLFNAATQARIQSPQDYQVVLQRYGALAQHVEPKPPGAYRNAWLARALEGMAYAQLKLGQAREAETTIARALSLDSNSAMVGITALKAACAGRADPARVRREFILIGQRLNREVARTEPLPAGNLDRRNARLERDLFLADPELHLDCDYAIPRQPAP